MSVVVDTRGGDHRVPVAVPLTYQGPRAPSPSRRHPPAPRRRPGRRRSTVLFRSTMSVILQGPDRPAGPSIVECVGFAAKNDISSTPSALTGPNRSGSSTRGRPCSSTAPMIVAQHTAPGPAQPRAGRSCPPGGTPSIPPVGSAPSAPTPPRTPRSRSSPISISATPPALPPHQPRRPTETRQVTDRHRHPVLSLGAATALHTAHEVQDRLDLHPLGHVAIYAGGHQVIVAARTGDIVSLRPVPTRIQAARRPVIGGARANECGEWEGIGRPMSKQCQ